MTSWMLELSVAVAMSLSEIHQNGPFQLDDHVHFLNGSVLRQMQRSKEHHVGGPEWEAN